MRAHTHILATGTAAQQSDLTIGDTIVAVDGESVLHLEPKAIVLRIAGIYKTEVSYWKSTFSRLTCSCLSRPASTAWRRRKTHLKRQLVEQVLVETKRVVKARVTRDVSADLLRSASAAKN